MVSGVSVVDGSWSVVDGGWPVVDGGWSMVDGAWSGLWWMVPGVAGGRW